MNAASISRKLRALGFRPVAPSDRNREGLKVRASNGGRVWVSADLDRDREARELATSAHEALVEAGYEVADGTPTSFYVVEKVVAPDPDPDNFDRAVRELSYQMGDGSNPSARKYEQYATLLRSLLSILNP